ncbi:hypothetical protein Slin15195_G056270 [Septoria linicola]|uniref:Uncharacterized protein n=1 Tax=Septoria linicola TaxID=215465 RepID=A0A9Q9EKE3_9PEZI|nr:hypothetical protein Slin14017_G072150 [Septoria linicola]USW52308.1 hypothetical protein Slin15195_G056270 [Septoria linicola]
MNFSVRGLLGRSAGKRTRSEELPSRGRVLHLQTEYSQLSDTLDRPLPPLPEAESHRHYMIDHRGRRHTLLTPLELEEQRARNLPVSKFATQPNPPNTSRTNDNRNSTSDNQHYRTKSLDAYHSRNSSRSTANRVRAQGCTFEMTVTDADTGISTPLGSNPPEMEEVSKRTRSRSSSRRRERADSHQEIADNVSSQDFATTPRTDGGLQVPALNIRKASDNTTRIPSPRSSPRTSPRSPAEDLPLPPQTAENLRKIPAIIPPELQYTHLPTGWKLVDPPAPKQSIASKAAKTLGFQSSSNNPRFGAAARNDARSPLPPVAPPFVPKPSPAVVRPPVYDPTKPAGLQWASPGINNSRPFQPW